MASSDNLHALARVRALALAAMIDQGGRPCWVVAAAAPAAVDSGAQETTGPGLTVSGDGKLTPVERQMLSAFRPAELARIEALMIRLAGVTAASVPSSRCVSGGRSDGSCGLRCCSG